MLSADDAAPLAADRGPKTRRAATATPPASAPPVVCGWASCTFVAAALPELIRHVNSAHLHLFDNYWRSRSTLLQGLRCRWTQCPVRRPFHNPVAIAEHMRLHTLEQPFRCYAANCGKHFSRREQLALHQRLVHSGAGGDVQPVAADAAERSDQGATALESGVPPILEVDLDKVLDLADAEHFEQQAVDGALEAAVPVLPPSQEVLDLLAAEGPASKRARTGDAGDAADVGSAVDERDRERSMAKYVRQAMAMRRTLRSYHAYLANAREVLPRLAQLHHESGVAPDSVPRPESASDATESGLAATMDALGRDVDQLHDQVHASVLPSWRQLLQVLALRTSGSRGASGEPVAAVGAVTMRRSGSQQSDVSDGGFRRSHRVARASLLPALAQHKHLLEDASSDAESDSLAADDAAL